MCVMKDIKLNYSKIAIQYNYVPITVKCSYLSQQQINRKPRTLSKVLDCYELL